MTRSRLQKTPYFKHAARKISKIEPACCITLFGDRLACRLVVDVSAAANDGELAMWTINRASTPRPPIDGTTRVYTSQHCRVPGRGRPDHLLARDLNAAVCVTRWCRHARGHPIVIVVARSTGG